MVTDNKKEAMNMVAKFIAVISVSLIHSNKITTKMSCMTGGMVMDVVALWSMGEAGCASLLLAGSRRVAHSTLFSGVSITSSFHHDQNSIFNLYSCNSKS